MRKPYPTDLSDAEWNYIEPHMPAPKEHGRTRIHSPREILDAIFYLLRSGCQWRLLPHDFPRWPTVYYYFRQWRLDGTWGRINQAIRERLRVRLKRNPQPTFLGSGHVRLDVVPFGIRKICWVRLSHTC